MIAQEEIDRDYIDSVEAARLLEVTDARIRRLCLDGRFQGAIKAGKSWLIPKIAVENFTRLRPGLKSKVNPDDRTIWANALKEANNLKKGDSQ